MFKTKAILAMAVLISGANASAQLKDGETIVFLGDSITAQGVGEKGYVTLFRQAIEKARPDAGIKVIGAGIGGHKVPNLEARLEPLAGFGISSVEQPVRHEHVNGLAGIRS